MLNKLAASLAPEKSRFLPGILIKTAIACMAIIAVYLSFNAFAINLAINPHGAANPSVPVPVSPTSGSTVPSCFSINFIWSNSTSSPGTTRTYHLQITTCDDPTFSHPVVDISSITEGTNKTTQNITVLLCGKCYIWRIKCVDSNGNQSNFSVAITFYTP